MFVNERIGFWFSPKRLTNVITGFCLETASPGFELGSFLLLGFRCKSAVLSGLAARA